MINIRYPKYLIVLNILVLGAILIAEIGIPVHANTQKLSAQARAESLKTLDEFFNDPNNLTLSGCDSATWAAVRLAEQTAIQEQELPSSSADNDLARNNQIQQCFNIVTDKWRSNEVEFYNRLHAQAKELTDIYKNTVPGPEAAKALAENISSKHREYSDLLDKNGSLQDILSFTTQASRMYVNHADQTRYNNLVERYNALV